jgi:hypothetical protein
MDVVAIVYIYCMLMREIWKCIHPRVSYSLRATPEGNMIFVGVTCMCFLGFIPYNKTLIACRFGKYENVFTHEYHIPLGRCSQGIWYSWVNTFSERKQSAIHRSVNSHLCYSPVNSTFQTNWMKLWKWYVYCNKIYIEKSMRSIIIKNIWLSIMEMIKWTIAPGCWPCAIVHSLCFLSDIDLESLYCCGCGF